MTKSNLPREQNLDTLLLVQNSFKADIKKLMQTLFYEIDKKQYKNATDKKTIELIGQTIEYMEAVRYAQDKLIIDLRFAWDSYYMKEEQEAKQFESFKAWFYNKKNKTQNGN